ncbi:hypothetical protein ACE1BG_07365 [Aeromonas veronii]|uniref:hypothetical protein n=1 Tax=Aeromonas veronii TaxID=654 RepID=UPI0035B878F3
MRRNERITLTKLMWLTVLFGPFLWVIFALVEHFSSFSFVFQFPRTLTTIIAAFSFTMLGFLAAIATYFFSLQKYRFFKRWVNDGNASVFFTLFYISIVCLFITFTFCLLVFSKVAMSLFFKLMLVSVTNNIFQLFLITTFVMNMVSRSNSESESGKD